MEEQPGDSYQESPAAAANLIPGSSLPFRRLPDEIVYALRSIECGLLVFKDAESTTLFTQCRLVEKSAQERAVAASYVCCTSDPHRYKLHQQFAYNKLR